MVSLMKDIRWQNAEQLGRAVRIKRLEKGLSQSALAAQLGVERKWVVRLESGNPKAALGLVLKVLNTLAIQASLGDEKPRAPSRLDEVFRRLQRPSASK